MLPLREMPQRLLTILRPPDLPIGDNAEEQRKYMVKVARYHLNMSVAVAVLMVGAIWAASPVGFARSASVEEQINSAIEPVKLEVASTNNAVKQISDAQAANGKLLRLSLGNGVATDIRFLKSKICESKKQIERERFQHEIEIKQDEYRELKTFEYNIPECDRL